MSQQRIAVLVTGATGMVGSELVGQMRMREEVELLGVSRRAPRGDSDMVSWDMVREPPPARVRRRWDVIVNAAAETRWTMGPGEAAAANVDTVHAFASLASPETHVIHISTAYALGLRGDTKSSDPTDFRNAYEWSKAQAENVARKSFASLTIVRPTLVIGRRRDGRAARFVGLYTLLRGIAAGTVPALVADPVAPFDAVPVDDLGCLLTSLALGPEAGIGRTVTIAAGAGAPGVERTLDKVVDALNKWRRERGFEPLQSPPLVSPEQWRRFFLPFVREHLTHRQMRILELLRSFEPYLALASPIAPDRTVENVYSCLGPAVEFWADASPRVAAMTPRPWRGGAKVVSGDA